MIGIYNDIGFYNPNGGATYTVEGKQVHINGAENTSISGAAVDMTPSQSFNGYDSPWVGGAGKNKAKLAEKSDTYYGLNIVSGNGQVKLTGTASSARWIEAAVAENFTLPAGTYTITTTASGTLPSQGLSLGIANHYLNVNPSKMTFSQTFTIASDTTYKYSLWVDGAAYDAVVTTQIEQGSTATEWEPYSNICPISGTSTLNLYRRSSESGSANTTYTQALGRTVHYGNFNYSTGKLTVTHALLSLTSSMSWSMQTDTLGNYRFYVPISGMKSNTLVDETMCTHFARTTSASYTKPFGNYYISGTGLYISDGVNPEQSGSTFFSTLADFKTWLDAQNTAGTPVQILYPLASSTEYTLTTSTISLLNGDNYFDTNSTASNRFNVSITYRDSMLYIKRPSDFAIEREDIYAGEYTTCTGSIKADRIGWKYVDTTINCDELTEEELSFFTGMSGATTFYFEDSDGAHSEQVIRTGFSNTPTRLTLPDGQVIWKNVGISLRFIDAHN